MTKHFRTQLIIVWVHQPTHPMSIQKHTFSQTEINDKLSTKQASITSSTSNFKLYYSKQIISRYFELPTGYTYFKFDVSNASLMSLTIFF